MMERPTLNVSVRENTGKGHNRRLRASGEIPGVLYGQGKTPVSFSVGPKPVVAMLNGDFGKNTVMNVAIEGQSETRLAIVKDFQIHPWKRTLVHLDLWEIAESTPLSIEVPFRKVGVSAVEQAGQKVRITRSTVKVRCTAADIPVAIEYDMTTVEGDYAEISVSEVPMPEGVEPLFRKDFKLIRMKVAAVKDLAEETEEGEASGDAEATEETSE